MIDWLCKICKSTTADSLESILKIRNSWFCGFHLETRMRVQLEALKNTQVTDQIMVAFGCFPGWGGRGRGGGGWYRIKGWDFRDDYFYIFTVCFLTFIILCNCKLVLLLPKLQYLKHNLTLESSYFKSFWSFLQSHSLREGLYFSLYLFVHFLLKSDLQKICDKFKEVFDTSYSFLSSLYLCNLMVKTFYILNVDSNRI